MDYDSSPEFFIGVGLACAGNALIACSLVLQKHCVNAEAATGMKASTMRLFWLSLVGMIGGEVGNFAAFGFASQTVVSPLGAMSVIVNTVLAAIFLRERIFCLTVLGIALTIGGSIGVVLFSPPPLVSITTHDFVMLLSDPYAYTYLILVACAIGVLAALQPRCGHRFLLINIMLCSLLGSITVICSTALSKFIRLALGGDGATNSTGIDGPAVEKTLESPVPYILVPTLVTTAVLQLRFLNAAMKFNASVVVPTYYVTFTLSSIAGGVWVFNESWRETWVVPIPSTEYYFFLSCCLCFLGVYFIAGCRRATDMPVTALSTTQRTSAFTDDDAESSAHGGTTPCRSGAADRRGGSHADAAGAPTLARASTERSPSRFRSGSASGAAHPRSASATAVGATSTSFANEPADLRGSISVVTGVGTLQHLHSAYHSWRGSYSGAVETLAGLEVEVSDEDAPTAGAPSGNHASSEEGLGASLMRNAA